MRQDKDGIAERVLGLSIERICIRMKAVFPDVNSEGSTRINWKVTLGEDAQ